MGIIKTSKLVHEFIRRDEEGNVESITTALDNVNLDIKEGQSVSYTHLTLPTSDLV